MTETPKPDDEQTSPIERTPANPANNDWLEMITWDGPPPSRDHLASAMDSDPVDQFNSVAITIPESVIEIGFVPESAEFIGVPVTARLNRGESTSPGVWRLNPEDLEGLVLLLPPTFSEQYVHITLKVAGNEQATGNKLTNMAAVRAEVPGYAKAQETKTAARQSPVPPTASKSDPALKPGPKAVPSPAKPEPALASKRASVPDGNVKTQVEQKPPPKSPVKPPPAPENVAKVVPPPAAKPAVPAKPEYDQKLPPNAAKPVPAGEKVAKAKPLPKPTAKPAVKAKPENDQKPPPKPAAKPVQVSEKVAKANPPPKPTAKPVVQAKPENDQQPPPKPALKSTPVTETPVKASPAPAVRNSATASVAKAKPGTDQKPAAKPVPEPITVPVNAVKPAPLPASEQVATTEPARHGKTPLGPDLPEKPAADPKPALEPQIIPQPAPRAKADSGAVAEGRASPELPVPPSINSNPGETRQPTGLIVARLGGAPEYGDPHYRIMVNGRQIASGNVDWSMGLPALGTESEYRFMCWQEVTIPWDFEDGLPAEISLVYDPGLRAQPDSQNLLAIDWLDVDGLRIPSSSAHVHVDGKRLLWPDDDLVWSWTGELRFDVAAAAAGGSRVDDTADGRAKGPTPPQSHPAASEPLLVKVSDSDLASPSVMAELAALRSFVKGQENPAIDADRLKQFAILGLAKGPWQDVQFVDQQGDPIYIDDTGKNLQGVPSTQEPAPSTQEPAPSTEILIADAIKLKEKYIRGIVWRATEKLGLTQKRQTVSTIGQPARSVSSLPGITSPRTIPKRVGQKHVKDFYGSFLKKALDKLQESILVDRGTSRSAGANDSPLGGNKPGDPAQGRIYGEQIKSDFFASIVAQTKAHKGSASITGQP